MGSMTTYLKDKIADLLLNGTAYTFPTDIFLALFTSATDDAGGGTEVTGGAYARISIFAGFAGSSGAWTNGADVAFAPASGADWGDVTHAAIYDDLTAGNMLLHTSLGATTTVEDGTTAKFAAGDLDFTAD